MKYLTEFSSIEEYNLVKDSLFTPQASYIHDNDIVVYKEFVTLSISDRFLEIDEEGGSLNVTVTSYSDWTASTSNNWITISPLTGGTGQTVVTITISASSEERDGTVEFTDGFSVKSVSITQNIGYSKRYLEFNILTGGTIMWCSKSSTFRTISYSKDNGESWSEITSSANATASGGGGQGSLEWSNGSSRTELGSHSTQARWGGNSNYNASSWSNEVTLTVSMNDQSAPTAYGSTTTYPTTATASATSGGGVGSLEWESAQSQSSVGSHSTRARWTGNGCYNASPWSNYVTVQMNKAA